MLNPSMQLLLNNVGNRYLLVNLAAQRARDIATEAEENGIILDDKSVKIALDEIADGKIQYRPGAKPEPEISAEAADDLTIELPDEEPVSDDFMESSDEF